MRMMRNTGLFAPLTAPLLWVRPGFHLKLLYISTFDIHSPDSYTIPRLPRVAQSYMVGQNREVGANPTQSRYCNW